MLTGTASAPAYSAGRAWGPSPLADQSIAGAIMWWGGDGLMMILMLVVVAQGVGTAAGSGSDRGWSAFGDRLCWTPTTSSTSTMTMLPSMRTMPAWPHCTA